MKTKSFLMIFCLFAGAALMSLSAQKTGTDQFWNESGYYTPVYCDGVWVDRVEGVITFHVVNHYKKGVFMWQKLQVKGEVTGMVEGEVFTIKAMDKYSSETGVYTWHYNLKGNMGNHYIGSLTYNYSNGEFTINKTVCH